MTISISTPCRATVTCLKWSINCHDTESDTISLKSFRAQRRHKAVALLSALYILDEEIVSRALVT